MHAIRFLYILFFFILVSSIACTGNGPGPVVPDDYVEFTIRAASSMEKIIAITDLSKLHETYSVKGCKGEHEAFQLVPIIPKRSQSLKNMIVQASNLTMGDQIIPSSEITIYVEHYINVTEPSDDGGKVGMWPDALVHLTTPFDVSGDFPSPVWIDVNIPRDAVPGIYNGFIVMSPTNGPIVGFDYTLEVWNIEMPKKKFIKANFGLDQEDIAGLHGLGEDLLSHEGREITRTYAIYLAERHISTHGVPILRPQMNLDYDNRSYTLMFGEMEKDIQTFLDGYDLSSFHFPLSRFDLFPEGFIGQQEFLFTDDFNARLIDYTEQVSQYFKDRGYLDRSFVLVYDEPQNEEHYQFIRDVSDVVRQASVYPDLMVTEQPRPQTKECGPLFDWVDIFVSCIRMFEWAGGEANARVGGENHEEWVYTNISVYPFPSYAIDKQGVETRLFQWYMYQHKFRGTFYGSALDWSQTNPWENPLSFGSLMGNGCNNFMYPGTMANKYTGQDNSEGPIGCVRLEQIRDGIEDAELLYMLGQGEPVPEAAQIMQDWWHYTDDPEELLRIREEVAHLIMGN